MLSVVEKIQPINTRLEYNLQLCGCMIYCDEHRRGEGERLINLIAIISILIDAYILVQYKATKLHLTQSRFDILYDETILAYI